MQGRNAEAEAVLLKLHADPSDPDNTAAKAELYQIQKQIAIDKTLGNTWWHILKKPSYRRRAFLAIGTTGIIQCSVSSSVAHSCMHQSVLLNMGDLSLARMFYRDCTRMNPVLHLA